MFTCMDTYSWYGSITEISRLIKPAITGLNILNREAKFSCPSPQNAESRYVNKSAARTRTKYTYCMTGVRRQCVPTKSPNPLNASSRHSHTLITPNPHEPEIRLTMLPSSHVSVKSSHPSSILAIHYQDSNFLFPKTGSGVALFDPRPLPARFSRFILFVAVGRLP